MRKSLTLQIDYHIPGYDQPHRRKVDPYHAVGYRAQWYLVAHCHYKQSVRVFALSRMTDIKVTNDHFDAPDDFDFQQYVGAHFGIFRSDEDHEVKVRFSARATPYVLERRWHPTQSVHTKDDGSIDLSFNANHLFEVKRWVLSWGADAHVLSPPELVEMVRNDHATAAVQYPTP